MYIYNCCYWMDAHTPWTRGHGGILVWKRGVSWDSSGHAVVVAVVVGRTGRSVHSCDIYCCSGCRGRSNVGGDRCSVALVSPFLILVVSSSVVYLLLLSFSCHD